MTYFFKKAYSPPMYIDYLPQARPTVRKRDQAFEDRVMKLRRKEVSIRIKQQKTSSEKSQLPWEVQKDDERAFPEEGGIEEMKDVSMCPQVAMVQELHPPPHRK